jgi:hypothetical protein
MTEPLRPLNLGGILDRGIQIFRAQPVLFFGLGAIPGLAQLGSALAAVHPRTTTDPNAAHILAVLASYGAALVFWVAKLVLQAVATAAICLAASRVQFGEAVSVQSAFGAFTSKGGRLVGLTFLQGIYAGWPFIIAAFIAVPMATSGASIFLQAPVWILGAVPCIALYTRYALAFPATAIEDVPAQSAIQRSISLGKGARWRICGGFLVPLVPAIALGAGAGALIEIFKKHSPLLAGSPLGVAGINGLVQLFVALVFTPFSAIVLTLLYYDQRIRREGYDIEQMMAAAGLNPLPTPPAPDAPVPSVIAEEGQA